MVVEPEEPEAAVPDENPWGTLPESNLELQKVEQNPSDSLEPGIVLGYALAGMGFPRTPNV